jgi:nicotinamidase-related amidase
MDTSGSAVLTMELQRGVCGDLATFDALADAVRSTGVDDRAAALVHAARDAGVLVVHCTFSLPADRTGIDLSSPLLRAARTDPGYLLEGSPAAELLAGLGPVDGDIVSDRHHGVSPFAGTDLHERFQTSGVGHLIVCGVSLNVGIPGVVIEAVNHGYTVTVATDAVVGVPVDYGDLVLQNTLRPIARLATVDEISRGWLGP